MADVPTGSVHDTTAVQPILRWAGSKRALLTELVDAVPPTFGRYFELFAGSACLFFALRPRSAVVGDANGELIGAYRTLRSMPRQVAGVVAAWPPDQATYYRVRAYRQEELGAVERAARFFYLNRLCFNGVYRTNRANRFNVPFGIKPGQVPSAERFVRCATALRDARLVAGDFEVATREARAGDFVYLDPPYSRSLSEAYGVYGYGSFDGSDLERMLATLFTLDRRGVRFLFSYRLSEDVLEATRCWNHRLVGVRAQVGGRVASRSVRHELLVMNYEGGA